MRRQAVLEAALAELVFFIFAWVLQPPKGYGWHSKLVMIALALAGILAHGKPKEYGLIPRNFRESLKWSTYILALFLTPSALLTALYPSPLKGILINLAWFYIFVGLAEELFFRGYIQSRLNEVFTKKYESFLGIRAEWTQGTLITAVFFFGLLHLIISSNPLTGTFRIGLSELLITASAIFLGLVFGVIRERVGCVYVPAALHGSIDFLTWGLEVPPIYSASLSAFLIFVFFAFMFERIIRER